jgi:ABC-type multidrug transport system fused ATPase/permease subunit
MARFVDGVVIATRRRLASGFLRASWATQDRDRSGQLQELLTTFTYQINLVVSSVAGWVTNAFNLLALLGLAVFVNQVAALVVIPGGLVVGSVLRPVRRAIQARGRHAADAGMGFATSLSEISELGMEVHVFGVHDQAEARVVDLIEHTSAADRRLSFTRSLIPVLYIGLAYAAVVAALAIVNSSGGTDLASVGAVMLIVLRSLSYGLSLQVSTTQLSASMPYLHELRARLEGYESGRRHDEGVAVGSVDRLEFDHVWFSYDDGVPVLKDLTFVVSGHEIVGIVGPSGSGKSTLVQLMLALRDPDRGAVLADGRPVSSLSHAEWARKVTFVPQAAHLVEGTVADNIRFFRDGVSRADIEWAAEQANLRADLEATPPGLDRDVGPRGGNLSGGQQQRLCIARALVERPDVLILDEPTSSLDVRSEHHIRSTLLGLSERMTVVIIAHRLSTLDICDRIMVIQHGELKGFDTPAELAKANDFYREALALSGMR